MRIPSRIAVAGTAAALAAAVLLLGGVLRGAPRAADVAAPDVAAQRLQGGFAAGDTEALVARLQAEVRAHGSDVRSLGLLGFAYLQRARETGDTGYYTRSAAVFRRAVALEPRDLVATSGLASLALSRHRFRDALALARRAQRISPSTARTYALLGDALVELGRYDDAFAAFDELARIKPGLTAYARVSYAQELLGRPQAAIATMKLALDASGGVGEPAAWTSVQLGKLYWSIEKLDAAARQYRAALVLFPGYVHALDGLAQVEAARGRLARAVALERRAVEAMPLPQFAASLGDLYAAAGRPRLARAQYALVGAIRRVLVANGVRTDLETALFEVDHGIRLRDALSTARRAQRERPSIDGDDVLAWALVRSGRCGEALAYAKRALRLGTLDATKVFHRGMVERCLGHRTEARRWFRRALALNPHFSVRWAAVAKRYAR